MSLVSSRLLHPLSLQHDQGKRRQERSWKCEGQEMGRHEGKVAVMSCLKLLLLLNLKSSSSNLQPFDFRIWLPGHPWYRMVERPCCLGACPATGNRYARTPLITLEVISFSSTVLTCFKPLWGLSSFGKPTNHSCCKRNERCGSRALKHLSSGRRGTWIKAEQPLMRERPLNVRVYAWAPSPKTATSIEVLHKANILGGLNSCRVSRCRDTKPNIIDKHNNWVLVGLSWSQIALPEALYILAGRRVSRNDVSQSEAIHSYPWSFQVIVFGSNLEMFLSPKVHLPVRWHMWPWCQSMWLPGDTRSPHPHNEGVFLFWR